MIFCDLHECEESCQSIWPLNASLHARSTCAHLRLLAGPFGQGLSAFESLLLYSELNKWEQSSLSNFDAVASLDNSVPIYGHQRKLYFTH